MSLSQCILSIVETLGHFRCPGSQRSTRLCAHFGRSRRSLSLNGKYFVIQALSCVRHILIRNEAELSNVKLQLIKFVFLAHPDHVSAEAIHHACLKIDTVALPCEICNHEAATLNLPDNL